MKSKAVSQITIIMCLFMLASSFLAGCTKPAELSTTPTPVNVPPTKQIEVNINGLAAGEEGTLRLGTEDGLDIQDTIVTYPLNGTGSTISMELSPALTDGYYILLLDVPTYYFRDPRGCSFMVSGGLIVDPTGSAAAFNLKPWPTYPILEAVSSLSAPPKQGMPVVPIPLWHRDLEPVSITLGIILFFVVLWFIFRKSHSIIKPTH